MNHLGAAGADDLATGLFVECTAIATPLIASMLRDIDRGAPVEADHILGDLLRPAGPAADKSLLHLAYSHAKVYERRRGKGGCYEL